MACSVWLGEEGEWPAQCGGLILKLGGKEKARMAGEPVRALVCLAPLRMAQMRASTALILEKFVMIPKGLQTIFAGGA